MKLSIAHGWDTGQLREINEDSYLVWQSDNAAELNGEAFVLAPHDSSAEAGQGNWSLILIADGIGGAAAGEVASKLAIETVAHSVGERAGKEAWDAVTTSAVEQADEAVRAARQEAGSTMGTTLVGALVAGSTAYVVNVGDSRGYAITKDNIQRITHDHSFVQYLVDSGQIREEEVRTHPQRNIITRSLGDKVPAQVDLFPTALVPNQILLLCTDGLWEMVEDEEIFEIVTSAPDLNSAATALVEKANENGGADNITVILAQIAGAS